jgi:hypothetical protein
MFGVVKTPTIIDIEASGFGSQSYPIEIGVALADGSTRCYLVLPKDEWTYWDEEAESVHRIPRDILEAHGRPLDEVAEDLNRFIGTADAFSDGWEVDKPWITQLFYAAGLFPSFRLSALDFILSPKQMEHWHTTKDQVLAEMNLKRHRASLDAQVIQKTYERTANLSN